MLLTISLFIKNIVGWIQGNPRKVITGIAILCVLLASVMLYRGCSRRSARMNEAEIQKAQEAIKTRNDEELRKVLVDVAVREAQIDANVADASARTVNVQHEAKKKYANMNISELQAEFDRRAKE